MEESTKTPKGEKSKKVKEHITLKSEEQRAIELQKICESEINETINELADIYPRISRVKKDENLSTNVFKMVVYTVLLKSLRELQCDSTKLTMRDFHRKYASNLPVLYRCDFTSDEFKQIIESSYLQERDKQIAYKFFVEKKNQSNVYDEMIDINDPKTVNNNLNTINDAFLYRACIYNKDNKDNNKA